MRSAPSGTSRVACASTSFRTRRTRTSTISTKSTATRRRWRRIGRRPTMPSGARLRTPWTARPRRRAARPSFPLRPGIGSERAPDPYAHYRRASRLEICQTSAMPEVPQVKRKPDSAIGLLVSRRFGPLFATQFLSAFNDNALRNALVLMIAYRADAVGQFSAQIMIPLAAGLFMLPFFLCSATAGQIADESDKSRLIRLIKLIEIPVMLAAAGGVLAGSATVLFALLFAMGIQAAFFGPLKYAILPDVLAPGELLLGNALVEAGTFIAILLGTIAGMLIATRHGAAGVAALIVLVAFAAWAASWGILHTSPAARRSRSRWSLFATTARVIREGAGESVPFRSMLGISWVWLGGATFLSQFPSYVRFILEAEAAVVTLFLTLFSVGIAFCSFLCHRLLGGQLSARCVPWGALGIGLFSIDLWLARPGTQGARGPAPPD